MIERTSQRARGFVHARQRECGSFAAHPASEAAWLTHLIRHDLQHLRNSWRQQLKILKKGLRLRAQLFRPAATPARAVGDSCAAAAEIAEVNACVPAARCTSDMTSRVTCGCRDQKTRRPGYQRAVA